MPGAAEPEPGPDGAPEPEQARVLASIRERLHAAIRKVCPPSMAAHTDDIVQLALLRVHRAMERQAVGDQGEPVSSAYLWRVAYTTTIDELRKVRSQANTRSHAVEATAAVPLAEVSPEATAVGSEVGVAIRGCLDALAPDRRRAVVLHLQGHSVPETATMLGWTPKRAENLVYRGLADLRRCLVSKGHAP